MKSRRGTIAIGHQVIDLETHRKGRSSGSGGETKRDTLKLVAEHDKAPVKIASHQGFFVGLVHLSSTNSLTGVKTADLRQIMARRAARDELTRAAPQHRRKWSRLSDEARATVIARYSEGETTTLLANEFGVAKSTILGILRANNVVVRRQPLNTKQVAEASRLYEAGRSLSEVAELIKVNQETMRVAMIASGVSMRPATGQ